MKETTVRVKVRPRRMTRAERKRIKRAQKAREELQLCQQAIAFHKAYLAIEMEHEEIKYDELQAVVATTEIVETVEAVEAPTAEAVAVEETVVEETVEETAEVNEEAEPVTAQ